MEKWSFCDDNDNLIKLVLEGKKQQQLVIMMKMIYQLLAKKV